MTMILQARVDEARLQKVNRIQRETGMSVSELFRWLIDVAEVKPLEATAILSTPAPSVTTWRDASDAVAA